MKKFFMMAVMAVAAVSANAQNEEGQVTIMPKAGMNVSTFTGDRDVKSKVGFVGGVEVEYGLKSNFGLVGGLLYSMQGAKVRGDNVKFNFDYLNIPILAQFYPIKGLAVKAGVQFGFNVRSKLSWDENGVSYSEKYNDAVKDYNYVINELKAAGYSEADELETVTSEKKNFYFAIPVGLSYEYKKFVLDVRYNIGLTRVVSNFKDKNGVFSFTLGYKIPVK